MNFDLIRFYRDNFGEQEEKGEFNNNEIQITIPQLKTRNSCLNYSHFAGWRMKDVEQAI